MKSYGVEGGNISDIEYFCIFEFLFSFFYIQCATNSSEVTYFNSGKYDAVITAES